MKTLVLGVGDAQVDLIRLCKDRGHCVHGLSYRREGRGIALVDCFAQIDIANKEKVADYAREQRVDLVYSVGSDIAMPATGYVAQRLGLPWLVDEPTAALMQNKIRLREFLARHDISPVAFREARDLSDLDGWDMFPAIMKPADSQGQRGVCEVRNAMEIRECFERSRSFSSSRTVILEQYLAGGEVSCNAFVRDGELMCSFLSDRIPVPGQPGGIIKAHYMPVALGDRACEDLRSLVGRTISALRIRNGPVYFQMKYDGTVNRASIIEVTPRLDGCHLWRLIKMMYGVDLLAMTVSMLSGEALPAVPAPAAVGPSRMGLEFYHQVPGKALVSPPVDQESLYEEFYYTAGEVVRAVNGVFDKVGYRIRALGPGAAES